MVQGRVRPVPTILVVVPTRTLSLQRFRRNVSVMGPLLVLCKLLSASSSKTLL